MAVADSVIHCVLIRRVEMSKTRGVDSPLAVSAIISSVSYHYAGFSKTPAVSEYGQHEYVDPDSLTRWSCSGTAMAIGVATPTPMLFLILYAIATKGLAFFC